MMSKRFETVRAARAGRVLDPGGDLRESFRASPGRSRGTTAWGSPWPPRGASASRTRCTAPTAWTTLATGGGAGPATMTEHRGRRRIRGRPCPRGRYRGPRALAPQSARTSTPSRMVPLRIQSRPLLPPSRGGAASTRKRRPEATDRGDAARHPEGAHEAKVARSSPERGIRAHIRRRPEGRV